MRKIFAIMALFSMLAFAGCTKQQVGCAVEDTLASAASNGVAAALQCTNVSAIDADMTTALNKLNLCSPTPVASTTALKKLSLPLALCQSVASIIVGSLTGGLIPSAWGCSASMAGADLTNLIVNACAGSPAPAPSAAPAAAAKK